MSRGHLPEVLLAVSIGGAAFVCGRGAAGIVRGRVPVCLGSPAPNGAFTPPAQPSL